MKKVYMFKGYSKEEKRELKKEYIKYEWKNILLSYIFIALSSSRPINSIKNGAIYVAVWFSIANLLSITAYINQLDYMKRKKEMRGYARRHKGAIVEKGSTFFPEIGGWDFLGMQMLAAILIYIILVPISFHLQFKDFANYMSSYKDFFVGIFVDTYIIAFCNIILQILIEFILDCTKDGTNIKKIIFKEKIKVVVCSVIFLLAISYYFNNEFAGLFGNVSRRVVGTVYVFYMLWPLFKCIKDLVVNNEPALPTMKKSL